ncbi:RNA polymerase sigma factor [Bacillus alkalisoli]|uniref:RNA polymerase sigma factor n=1 Tax=Bacillus alkalisoli TaxID=2011008 RepID=UPI0012FEE36F|nr:RNA polymerase sigma factor [Bacillus alkalisoli]
MEGEWTKQKLNEWYGNYSDEIYRYVLMMTGDQELAKDLTHDTFIKAYLNLDSYRGDTSERNWLYKIARNAAYDEFRKRKSFRFVMETFAANLTSTDYIPEQVTQQGEYETQVYRSLQKIKRSYRDVIILRKVKELSIRETADILNWNEGKVKTTLHRALEALKKQMKKEGYNHET